MKRYSKSLIIFLAPLWILVSLPTAEAAGISAGSSWDGGHFWNVQRSGYAWVASGDLGIEAVGNDAGGHFSDGNSTGFAAVATGDYGIRAGGIYAGGTFDDKNSGSFAYVGFSSYKIWGTGSVNFVQNHPGNKDEVIVYAAPEGDEVATYTRGSARLVNGEVHIPLGETFKWVTNPDIGLTAHLTPIGAWAPLYVASKTTQELVVKSAPGFPNDVEFDYLVYGLRIGFEDTTVVQKKAEEARIPSMADHRKQFEDNPELHQYSALSRYARMRGKTREAVQQNLPAAAALLQAVGEFDPKIHNPTSPEQTR